MNEEIIQLFNSSQRIMAFSGAGMSVASGIPDFRSKHGLYSQKPEKVMSRQFFFDHTEHFYDFFFENIYHPEAAPNEGHRLLAKWEKEGKIIDIVTQNIDGLHQKAGNSFVTEFHGTAQKAFCHNPKCRKEYSMDEVAKRREKDWEHFYLCDCHKEKPGSRRYIKPDVVLYDEKGVYMSNKHVSDIRERMWKADLILVLGTRLEVYPFRSFIDNKPKQKPMVIINKDRIWHESLEKTYAIHEDISETLRTIDVALSRDL